MPDARHPLFALLLAFAAGSSGCSFAFLRPPPKAVASPSKPHTPCESAPLAPAVDVLLATASGALLVKSVSGDTATTANLMVGGLLIGTLTSSAIYGFWIGSRCGDLKELNVLCMKGDQAACLALNPAFDRARPDHVPLLCAQDTDCPAGQACTQSACVEPTVPAPTPPPKP